MTHFRGRVSAWDVVNEALNDDGTRRNCLWQRVIGDDWVEQAFRFARSADPDAKLFYNETRADVPNPKYEATLTWCGTSRRAAFRSTASGSSSTWPGPRPTSAPGGGGDPPARRARVAVHISEIDGRSRSRGTLERKLARQAQAYRAVAAACHAQPACFRITTWGFTDRYTWRLPWGSTLPLPFDSEYQPKPAWTAIQEAIHPPPLPLLPAST